VWRIVSHGCAFGGVGGQRAAGYREVEAGQQSDLAVLPDELGDLLVVVGNQHSGGNLKDCGQAICIGFHEN
jgi:hypothetical protein